MIEIPAYVNGRLEPVEKLEAHELGLRHLAVSVFILNGNRLLLQQRALGKYHTPGLWANTCCTHPKWNEDMLACAVRRLEEEVGLTDIPLRSRDQLEYRADVGNGLIEHELVTVFVGHANSDQLMPTPNPDEVKALRWVDLEDLRREVEETPEQFTPWLRIYMRDHFSQIFGGLRSASLSLAPQSRSVG
ncbi:MAG: isopentenyl-diphosphate Delta-isomerase [Pseudomonadota bacterium]